MVLIYPFCISTELLYPDADYFVDKGFKIASKIRLL